MPPFKPYSSKAQERLFNSKAKPEGVSDEDVQGKNKVSKGMNLPTRVKGSVKVNKRHFNG
jgi:hypothetical protein